jgi:hypothetical protein
MAEYGQLMFALTGIIEEIQPQRFEYASFNGKIAGFVIYLHTAASYLICYARRWGFGRRTDPTLSWINKR